MWLANTEGNVVVNSDNVGYLFFARYDKGIVIRAHLVDGTRVTLRQFLHEDADAARIEFTNIQAMVERDHQRRCK